VREKKKEYYPIVVNISFLSSILGHAIDEAAPRLRNINKTDNLIKEKPFAQNISKT